MKVCIFGSRTWTDYDSGLAAIDKALAKVGWQPIIVVSGTANGADLIGEAWAKQHDTLVRRFPADWKKYGKSAGYRRNVEMADYADAGIALWDKTSRGTKMMLELLMDRGKPFMACYPDGVIHRYPAASTATG